MQKEVIILEVNDGPFFCSLLSKKELLTISGVGNEFCFPDQSIKIIQ